VEAFWRERLRQRMLRERKRKRGAEIIGGGGRERRHLTDT